MVGSREKLLSTLQEDFIGLEESQALPEPHTREQVELLRHLNFVPPTIDFGKWSVGQTVTQIVTLFNHHTNRTVHLNSVAGPEPVFYSSFFGTREVPPQGNTTFSVVFLPRQLGAISTGLLIQTSFGRAEFEVRGEGSECPYRLKPLVGIKAPMNATLTPEIHMYNPHERPLQILEVYSSGGEFQLELPSGGSEGPQNLWEIPPHSLKPVIRISFHGRTAGNHSAYIRIKIAEHAADDDHLLENVLVIPVEFEILPRHGAYARNPLADFGRLATDQHADALRFKLDMQNMQPVSKLIGNYLRHIPGLSYDAHNASIVLDPKLFEENASINDLLVIGGDNQQQPQFTVLVRAEIFKGGLGFDRNCTLFITSGGGVEESPLETQRTLLVRNNFGFPLLLHNLSVEAPIDPAVLQLSSLEQEILLQPGESVDLLQLHLLNEQATFKSMLLIASNVTTFELPLIACSGRLHVSTQPYQLQLATATATDAAYGLELDLGTVPFAEMSRDGYVILRNDNPMPIKITNWNFKPPKDVYFQAAFMGCVPRDGHDVNAAVVGDAPRVSNTTLGELKADNNGTQFEFCVQLREGDRAVFILSIQTHVAEESSGTLKVWTPFELIRSTVRFKASVGQLDIEQEQLQFKSCFPGKICSAVLSIRSTYVNPVHVKSVAFTRRGLRFKDFNAKGTTIGGQTLTKVGRIYFEPAALCGTTCYIRSSLEDHAIFPSLAAGVGQTNNNLLYDGVEVRQRTELYRQFKRQLHSMSLTLHTEELPPLELDFSIAIEWPKLVQHQPLPPAPTIAVGQVQRQWITMSNPTMQPLLLDYFLSDPAYARRTQLSLPHEVIDVSSSSCYLTDRAVFSLPDAPFHGPVLLPPGSTLTIPVQFSAEQADKYCTLLHVRSNLTLYEAVWITARAVDSQFRFGNRRPGSTTPLLFEFNAEQFERCDGSNSKLEQPNHIVMATRSFTARNAGALPMFIQGFLIGQRFCEGYGFRVIDCQSFWLHENETRKIEISFSTDFTAARVQRTLTLVTNLSYDINYQLLAQLPAESMERCATSLPRPEWEPALRNAALVILLVSFCLVLLAAVFDARAIMAQQSAYDAARFKGPIQPTFNLRNIVKLQVAEEAAAAAAAAQQQQKLRNGQLKDLRKRTTADKLTTATQRKPKSWSVWSMDMTAAASATVAPATAPAPVKPLSSPKPSKKVPTLPPTPPAAPAPAAAAPRASRKPKQATPIVATSAPMPTPIATPKPTPKAESEPEKRISPNAKPNSSPSLQENVSPRTLKLNPDTPKERVLKEQNGSAKKLGKTPGRERRKEQKLITLNGAGNGNGKKSGERAKQRSKQLNFNGNAIIAGGGGVLTLTTPDVDASETMITSPWETSSRVSFRDVLQTRALPALDNGLNWNPAASDLASSQLGPIGSRKSPTVTSLWDPPMISDSAVDDHSPMSSVFDVVEPPPLDMDLPTLNDLSRQQTQAQWERSELILWQQLLLDQLEQQRKQQEKLLLLSSSIESNNWALNLAAGGTGATWTPLGYAAWPQHGAATPRTSPAHTITPGVGVIRPPPGLESNYNNKHNNNNCQLTAAVAGVGVATSSGGATATAPLNSNNNNNSNVNNSNNNHIDGLAALQDAQERVASNAMPTHAQYDPFTSPSSIWSDNWRQRNNHMN
ncbi:GH22058 [Drosophila grimshawi]|uniref:GH22058 n=1 Tax=Drosophila grimshawi TaxID=7222 RepID=B4J9W5_DROGR|nr:GH22058 [Drosophila grimshawi]